MSDELVMLLVLVGLSLLGGAWLARHSRPREFHAFTCPRCGGHCFGASHVETVDTDHDIAMVSCHGSDTLGSGGCGFMGRYVDHVRQDPNVPRFGVGVATTHVPVSREGLRQALDPSNLVAVRGASARDAAAALDADEPSAAFDKLGQFGTIILPPGWSLYVFAQMPGDRVVDRHPDTTGDGRMLVVEPRA